MSEKADGLEGQIRNQVGRTGSLVTGEFDEASAQGLAKYVVSVHQSVEHLESLCAPITDEEYVDQRPDSVSNISEKVNKGRFDKILNRSKKKYRHLVRLLHRKGVL